MSASSGRGDYRINIEAFEGPLDLLLHLIKKNDLDIYDIPIAFLLEEYMRHLDAIGEPDIDLAGEFLLMAAELAHIKSQMLLPAEEAVDEDEGADPRADLVRRLLEYQQFKEAGERIAGRWMLGREVFVPLAPERVTAANDGPIEGNLFDLAEAFARMLKRVPAEKFHEVTVDRISINDRIYQIIALVKKGQTVSAEDLLPEPLARYDVVITFIALLEMCRLRMVRLHQAEAFGRIYIQGMMEEVGAVEAARLVETEGVVE